MWDGHSISFQGRTEKSTIPDNLLEALDAKDFADDITSGTITDFEEAMIKYERLNEALNYIILKKKLIVDKWD